MRKIKIWISTPMSIDIGKIESIAKTLAEKYTADVYYWDRKSKYDKSAFLSADVVCFFAESWSFRLTKGCLGEFLASGKRQNQFKAIIYQKTSGHYDSLHVTGLYPIDKAMEYVDSTIRISGTTATQHIHEFNTRLKEIRHSEVNIFAGLDLSGSTSSDYGVRLVGSTASGFTGLSGGPGLTGLSAGEPGEMDIRLLLLI